MAKFALGLSAVALGVALFALARRPPEPPRAPPLTERTSALAADIKELQREVELLKAGRPHEPPSVPPPAASFLPAPPEGAPTAVEGGDQLQQIVDDAVTKKTEKVIDKLRAKANKKPAMDAFAAALELTEPQRDVTARTVAEGQRQVHEILATPTLDGTNLLDQLVEIAAKGIAEPGKDPGWGPWYVRVLTEKVPGTQETYGWRIEAAKNVMRAAFRRDWTEQQYKEFEEWGVDPTEIQNVPNSPNDALFKRILERARQLGANVPGD